MPHFIRDPYKVLLSNFVCIYFFPVSYPTFTTIENHSHIVIKYPFLTCSYKMYIVSYAHVIDFCKVYCAAQDYFSPSLLLLVPVLLLRMCMTGDVVHQHTSPLYPPSDKNPNGLQLSTNDTTMNTLIHKPIRYVWGLVRDIYWSHVLVKQKLKRESIPEFQSCHLNITIAYSSFRAIPLI